MKREQEKLVEYGSCNNNNNNIAISICDLFFCVMKSVIVSHYIIGRLLQSAFDTPHLKRILNLYLYFLLSIVIVVRNVRTQLCLCQWLMFSIQNLIKL